MNQTEQRLHNIAEIARQRREATHCGRGHEYTEANTIIRSNGRRNCRECVKENARMRAYKKSLGEFVLEIERQRARAEFWKRRALGEA